MTPPRALGVDLGARRIGLALSVGGVSVPHDTLERGDGDPSRDRDRIIEIARAARCEVIVVGIPRSLDGTDGPAARSARAEVEALSAAAPDLEVVGHDERFTTVIAEQRLHDAGVRTKAQRGRIDESAAAVMLQSFLERQA